MLIGKVSSKLDFDEVFGSLYEAKSPESTSLFLYVQRLLYQFRLKEVYEVKDILVEVYARGIKVIEKGQTIHNPQAWIKRVALNVIRELRRAADRIKFHALDEHPYLASLSEDTLSQIVFQNDLKVIQMAFEELSPEDKNILNLRVIHRFSWQEISTLMAQEGNDVIAENALRQRGYRALQRLRNLYDVLRENFRSDDFEVSESDNFGNDISTEYFR